MRILKGDGLAQQGEDAAARIFGEIHRFVMIGLLGGLAAFVICAIRLSWPVVASAFAISVLVAGVSFAIGGLVGLLFGIPRATSKTGEPATEQTDIDSPGPGFRHNTNLEQISDWLTKILVGVGLVEFTRLTASLPQLGKFLASGLGDDDVAPVLGIVAVGYFGLLGLLDIYMWTRLRLFEAFGAIELQMLMDRVNRLERRVDAQRRAFDLTDLVLHPVPGVPAPSQEELISALKAVSPATRTAVFREARDIREHAHSSDPSTVALTVPIFRALIQADEDRRFHRAHAELAYALQAQTNPDWRTAEAELTTAIKMRDAQHQYEYEPPWYEGNRALCRIKSDANFQHNYASAPATREHILADYNKAEQDTQVREWLNRIEDVQKWLKLNTAESSHADTDGSTRKTRAIHDEPLRDELAGPAQESRRGGA